MKISKRWMPAVVTPAVIAAISLVPLQASAVDLPDMSAEELMVMMMDAQPTEFSGTIMKTSNLGLPAQSSAQWCPKRTLSACARRCLRSLQTSLQR